MHYAFFYSLLPEPRFLLQGDNMLQEIAVLLQSVGTCFISPLTLGFISMTSK